MKADWDISPPLKIAMALFLVVCAGTARANDSYASKLVDSDHQQGNYYWFQTQFGGSFYDQDDEAPVIRGSLGVQVGHRYGSFGVFANVDFDRTLQGAKDVGHIRYTQVGPGIDYLTRTGLLRVSASGGLSILNSGYENGATGVNEPAGTRGWYIEVRPISVRWNLDGHVLELSPLSIELTRPFGNDSVTIFDQYVKIAYEL